MLPIAFVTIPQFAIQLELQRRGLERPREPVILVTAPEDGARVFARSPEAGQRGVAIGQPLRLALTHCNEAVFWTADVVWYQARFEAWLDALEAVTPLVMPDSERPGSAWLGLRGLERLYGDDAWQLALHVAGLTLESLGLEPRIGVAAGLFQARLAAVAGTIAGGSSTARGGLAAVQQMPGERIDAWTRWRLVADAAAEADAGGSPGPPAIPARSGPVFVLDAAAGPAFLGRFGIDALPLAAEQQRRLKLLGIHSVAHFSRLRRSEAQLQCGIEGARAWDLATGHDSDQLVARRTRMRLCETARFPGATAELEFIMAALRHLGSRLLVRPEVAGRFVRDVVVRAALSTGTWWERRVVFREPVHDVTDLLRLLRVKFGQWQLPGAIEELQLEAGELCGEPAQQPRLLMEHAGESDNLKTVMDQLETRLGEPAVCRIIPVEPWSRIPERRYALVYSDGRTPTSGG